MKNKWLDRNLLELNGYYTLCTTEKQYRSVLKHLRVKGGSAPTFLSTPQANATVHHFNCEGKYCAVVCLGNTKERTNAQVLALLVHEAVHIWQEFKENIGEREPGRETEAYAIQSISQSLITEYFRQKDMPK